MDIQATRIELAKKILSETREAVLEKISQVFTKSDEIVAYTTAGTPLSKSDYEAELKQAEQDVRAGRTISHTELKKKVRSWQKH